MVLMTTITLNDQVVNCTEAEATTIEILMGASGFAAIHEYIPSSNWEVRPVQTINAVVGFKVSSLYRKQIEALKALKFSDVKVTDKNWKPSHGKNSCDNAQDQFDLCVAKLIESKIKTLNQTVEQEAEDAHRRGHQANYITINNSIKVNLVNEKNEDGHKRPVLDEHGNPTVETILIPYTWDVTKTLQEGVRKKKNSGSKVLMDNIINAALPKNLKIKQCSLKADNFKCVKVISQEIHADLLHAEEQEELKTLKA